MFPLAGIIAAREQSKLNAIVDALSDQLQSDKTWIIHAIFAICFTVAVHLNGSQEYWLILPNGTLSNSFLPLA
jgi:hypothetical protein